MTYCDLLPLEIYLLGADEFASFSFHVFAPPTNIKITRGVICAATTKCEKKSSLFYLAYIFT